MTRRIVRVMAIVIAVCAVAIAIDVVAGGYLAREEQKWRHATLQEHESLRTYQRQFLVGERLDQNAAVWYRLAFEKLRPQTAETHRELLPLVSSATRPAGDVIEAAYRDRCAEAESTRVQAALASTHCDWEIPYDFRASSSEGWFQAMVLAECLTLKGARHLERGDWAGSARAYLTALAVASDFSQGTLEMNVVAVTAAQWAVRGFAEAISESHEADLIDKLAAQFSQFEAVIPSFRVGLRQHQLTRAVQATEMARAYAYDRRYGLSALVPWRAIAAWRLSQQERIISSVSVLISTSDPAERSRLVNELSQPGPLSAPVVPSTVNDALSQRERLIRDVHAAQMVVKLQQLYVLHGEYPAASPDTNVHDVEYERTDEGKGYRLRTRSETGALVVFLERMPDVRAP